MDIRENTSKLLLVRPSWDKFPKTSRRNGRAYASRAAEGGGLPDLKLAFHRIGADENLGSSGLNHSTVPGSTDGNQGIVAEYSTG